MVFGERRTKNGLDYMMASESVALDVLGFNVLRDIDPGEAVFITKSGKVYSQQCAKKPKNNPCIFEYVYLARPDSIINGISVYNARLRIGEKLAHKIMNSGKFNDIDVIIPIPETSRTLAIQMSGILQVPVREGFVKNHYIGRTFIMPGQQMRKKSVRQKLNLIKTEFKDKNVLLVDDSIVRGTTSAQIIQLARDAGAKNVYFASAAPPVRYPNVYGIDLPASSELIASGREEQEICQILGADNIIYQDLEDLVNAVGYGTNITEFDTSCFSNIYVTGDIDSSYLQQTQSLRSDSVKK
jgi:amidophosphoribosyltransferase